MLREHATTMRHDDAPPRIGTPFTTCARTALRAIAADEDR